MLHESIYALGCAYKDVGPPSAASLIGISDTIEEIKDEISAVHGALADTRSKRA
jgi:hypothetical protein